jgi:hypothetical protein
MFTEGDGDQGSTFGGEFDSAHPTIGRLIFADDESFFNQAHDPNLTNQFAQRGQTKMTDPAELRTARAKKIDRYCRVIVPVVFVIASIVIFAHPRG